MVHTLPDYQTKYKMTTIFGQIDTGELAVRLGSPVIFDRRGNVIVYDDFEGVFLKWDEIKDLVTNSATVAANRARSRSQSCKIDPGKTVNKYCGIENNFIIPQIGKIGFEISFTQFTLGKYIEWLYTLYTGAYKYEAGIRYTIVGGKLEYYDDAPGWSELHAGIKLYGGTHTFHTLKVVVDASTGKYVRVMLNNNSFPMSTFNMDPTEDDTAARLYFSIKAISNGITSQDMWVDDFILTQNEP